jgi:hypothetical protein
MKKLFYIRPAAFAKIKVRQSKADTRLQGKSSWGGQTKMEIGPVANIRIVPMVKSQETDLGMTDVYDIERSSRIDDETYTPSGAKAGAGSENDEDETYDDSDDLEDDTETRGKERSAENGQVDFVA